MKTLLVSFQVLFLVFASTLSAAENNEAAPAEEKKTETPVADKAENKTNQTNSTLQTQAGSSEAEKTLKEGLLAFPPSQQVTPLISFGQNIFDKKQTQVLLAANKFNGEHQYSINIIPSYIYTFTDSLSLFLSVPIAVRNRQKHDHSSGVGDAIIQAEYAFYTKAYKTFYDQATIVANVTIPTGSTKKNPNTGIGSNSFFIGYTFSRNGINWLYFMSSGGLLTTSSHRTKFGSEFLYQCGIVRRIANTKEWLFAFMLEFDGTYTWKNKIHGTIDQNSGGNVIYLTPSLWISSAESLIFQIGIGFPVQQHLFGHQEKNDYLIQLNTGWTF